MLEQVWLKLLGVKKGEIIARTALNLQGFHATHHLDINLVLSLSMPEAFHRLKALPQSGASEENDSV